MARVIAALVFAWSMASAGVASVAASELDGCPEAVVVTFGDAAPTACRITWCEARWNNLAVGLAGEVSYWQIHPIHFHKYDRERLRDDEWYAAEVAFEMSRGGTNWRPWSCWRH